MFKYKYIYIYIYIYSCSTSFRNVQMCQAVEWTFPHFASKRLLFRASLSCCVLQLHANQCERMTSNFWICLRQVAQRRIGWCHNMSSYVMVRPDVPCSSCRCPGKTRGAPSVSLWPSRTATKHRQCAKINAAPATSSCSKPVVARSHINSKAKTDAHSTSASHGGNHTLDNTMHCTDQLINVTPSYSGGACCQHMFAQRSRTQSVSLHNSVRALTGIRCVNDVSGHLRFELLGPFDLFPLPLLHPCERQSQPTFQTPTRLGPFRSFGRS